MREVSAQLCTKRITCRLSMLEGTANRQVRTHAFPEMRREVPSRRRSRVRPPGIAPRDDGREKRDAHPETGPKQVEPEPCRDKDLHDRITGLECRCRDAWRSSGDR